MIGLNAVDKIDLFLKEQIKILLDVRAKPIDCTFSSLSMFDKKDIDYLFEDEYAKLNFSSHKDCSYVVDILMVYNKKRLLIERWTFLVPWSVQT